MKKFILSLFLLFVASIAMADLYTVAVSTYNPTTEIGQADGSFPNISGNARIGKITIANAGATIQTITVYKLSSSSTTASAIAVGVSDSTGTLVIDLEGEIVSGLGITKSATGSVVNITIKFK